MTNPFIYGEAVAGKRFCNRKEEIKALGSSLSSGQNVILFSPRRHGKTSLILKILEMLKENGFLTFYVDLYAATSKKKFVELYAQAIAHEIKANINKMAALLRELLPRMLPKLVIKPGSIPEIEFDFKGTNKNTSLTLSDVYEAVPKYAKQKKKQAVVVFDEFQEILNLEDDEIERTLRSHIQQHHNVAYVFMGSKKHLMLELFNHPDRPFYRSGRLFPLPKIKAEDFVPFLQEKFEKGHIKVNETTLTDILTLTECHPYYTQLFCSVLWELCSDKKKIETSDLIPALSETLTRGAAAYLEMYDPLTGPQKKLLLALAQEESYNLYSKEFLLENELGTPTTVQRSIQALIKKGFIEKEEGNYFFSDIFFKKWLIEKLRTKRPDHHLENDPRFLARIEQVRSSLRMRRDVKLEDIK